MKLSCGVVLLCLSALWAVFWLSDPLLGYSTDYQVVSVLVAGLALIPVFWATSLIDQAWRSPVAPAAAKRLPVEMPHIEAKAERDGLLTRLSLDEPAPAKNLAGAVSNASVANAIAEVESPTPSAA